MILIQTDLQLKQFKLEKHFGILPSAGLLVGGGGVDIVLLLVLLCVEGLVRVDEFLKGVELMLEVPCCTVVTGTGVVTSFIWRHRGSRLWGKEKKSVKSFAQKDRGHVNV